MAECCGRISADPYGQDAQDLTLMHDGYDAIITFQNALPSAGDTGSIPMIPIMSITT